MDMRKICIVSLLLSGTELLAAECPTDAVLSVDCKDQDAIQHIKNKHCKTPGIGPEQFEKHYCNNLVRTCLETTTSPDAKYSNNCYKKGEDGEIVGYLSDGRATNCYQATFKAGQGMGTMILITMYPTKEEGCTRK